MIHQHTFIVKGEKYLNQSVTYFSHICPVETRLHYEIYEFLNLALNCSYFFCIIWYKVLINEKEITPFYDYFYQVRTNGFVLYQFFLNAKNVIV